MSQKLALLNPWAEANPVIRRSLIGETHVVWCHNVTEEPQPPDRYSVTVKASRSVLHTYTVVKDFTYRIFMLGLYEKYKHL